jgi:hypothetical protein
MPLTWLCCYCNFPNIGMSVLIKLPAFPACTQLVRAVEHPHQEIHQTRVESYHWYFNLRQVKRRDR